MNAEQAAQLRQPFPKDAIGKLPKGGTQLDYVGHAAVTDRLLAVDPNWSWRPLAFAPDGGPLIRMGSKEASLWIELTVCDVTRLGVGICQVNAFELEKQLVSDAIRNAAMRFGVALDLWSRQPLLDDAIGVNAPAAAAKPRSRKAAPDTSSEPALRDLASKDAIDAIKVRVDRLDDADLATFTAWKYTTTIQWPWTVDDCKLMDEQLDNITMEGPF